MPVPAPYRRRALAAAIDLAWGALPLVLVAPLAYLFWTSGDGEAQLGALFVLAANAALGLAVWTALNLYAAFRRRPTPGRRIAKVELVRADGQEAPLGRKLARSAIVVTTLAIAILTGLPSLVALGPVSALALADARAFWDRFAGTVVIDARVSADT